MMAFEAETGLLSNRLTLSWLSGQPEDISSGSSSFEHRFISEDNSRKRSGEEVNKNLNGLIDSCLSSVLAVKMIIWQFHYKYHFSRLLIMKSLI